MATYDFYGCGRPAGKVKLLSLTDIDWRCKAPQHAEEMRSTIAADSGEELSTLERALVGARGYERRDAEAPSRVLAQGRAAPIGEVVISLPLQPRSAAARDLKRVPKKDVISIDSDLKKGDAAE